jgi:hypothetical protein
MLTKNLERPKAVVDTLTAIQKAVKINVGVPFDMLVMEASVIYKNFVNKIDREGGLRLIRCMVKTEEWTTVAGVAAAIKLDEEDLMRLIEIGKSDPLQRRG